MSNRALLYIAGPYGAPDAETRLLNTLRICAISRYAVKLGFAPIVVHPTIHMGGYGDDEDPADRDAGLEVDVRLLEAVGKSIRGQMWVLTRDDSTLSSGTRIEVSAWCNMTGRNATRMWNWAGWVDMIAREHPKILTDLRLA